MYFFEKVIKGIIDPASCTLEPIKQLNDVGCWKPFDSSFQCI